MTDWHKLENKYFTRNINRIPLTLVKGKGAHVWDENRKEYLDFVCGLAVNSLGHCHPAVIDAVTEQVNTLVQTSNLYYTIPQVKLAELLVRNSCMDKVFFCNSGLEANETAVKLARRYGALRLNGAYEVVTALGSFHGRSLALTASSGQKKLHEPYLPLPAGFINIPNNDIEAIKAATTDKTCAVMLELIQAETGINMPDTGFPEQVSEWCDRKGILLILDEVQTGIGRLGTLFGYQSYGIEPDIITLAKGLGGGMPIGAMLAKEHAAVFKPGDHNSTFGGNPVTNAAGYAVLKYIIENRIPDNVAKTGRYLMDELLKLKNKYSFITDVRGKGLLLAVQFMEEISEKIMLSCLDKGLIVNNVTVNAIRLVPPLIITKNDVDKAAGILDSVFSEFKF